MKKHLRIAAEGTAIGLVAAFALISGIAVIVRWAVGDPLGHKMPLACGFFTMTLFVVIYRLFHIKPESSRRRGFVIRNTVTELSTNDKTKSA